MQNQITNNYYASHLLIAVVGVFLLTESIRKYYYNDFILLMFLDFTIISLFLLNSNLKAQITSLGILLAFAIHGILFSIFYAHTPLAFIAGWREIIPCLVGFYLASSQRLILDATQAIHVLICSLIGLTIFASLQIYFGRSHFLNYIPANQDLGRGQGLGSYDPTVQEIIGVDLFRPATIFFTTGKYGATVAGLTILAMTILVLARPIRAKNFYLGVWIIMFLANLVAMQRAFFYPFCLLTICILLYEIYKLWLNQKFLRYFILASVPIILMVSTIIGAEIEEIVKAVSGRLYMFPEEVRQRISDLGHLESLMNHRPFFGSGFGFFSNYSFILGGGIYTHYYEGEGGWHIIASNLGFLGLIIFIILFICLIIQSVKYLVLGKQSDTYPQLIFCFVVSLLFFWGYTHHIYAQPFLMFCIFFSLGLLSRTIQIYVSGSR